jgi:hypothetical protein
MENIIKDLIHRKILSPRCIQEINSLEEKFSVSESEDTWGISPPRGHKIFTYNLKTPTTNSEGYIYRILIFDHKVFHRHLLWHTLYKGITVLEWFCLSQSIEFLTKRSDSLGCGTCLVGVLRQSSITRKRISDLTSRLRPIFRSFKSRVNSKWKSDARAKDGTLLDYLHQVLDIPQKGLPITELYSLKKIEIPRIIPQQSNRIGVGYKDKGSMGPEGEDPLPSDDQELTPFFEVNLYIQNWKTIESEFSFL